MKDFAFQYLKNPVLYSNVFYLDVVSEFNLWEQQTL